MIRASQAVVEAFALTDKLFLTDKPLATKRRLPRYPNAFRIERWWHLGLKD
ncbi:MAG: hypothetical protein AB8B97_16880 [Granulosicoccus sp.]